MRFVLLSFLILTSLSVHAQIEEPCENDILKDARPLINAAKKVEEKEMKKADEDECPNRKKFKNICLTVSGQMEDQEGKNEYLYQTRILEGSCVDTKNDSKKVKFEKIKTAWKIVENDLKCNSTQFDVKDGNIIKYAVSNRFDDFIEEIIEWKVDLNRIDPSDNRTVLDYLKYHIDRNKGKALEEKFQIYYDQLRKAGAKHQSEL